MHHPQTKPLVTVVTAVRNLVRAGRSAAVIECLESVHQQDYPQIEHLVIDGASDDGTLELLRPYETKGWIKIYSEADNGLYDAFNKGLARASGKYINFMNSDDHFIEDRAVSLSVKRLEESRADISYSDWRQDNMPDLCQARLPKLFFSMPFCHQTVFCKTSLLRKMGGFDERYPIAADRHFLYRAFVASNKFVKVKMPLAFFRMGGWSTRNSELTMEEDYRLFKEYAKSLGQWDEKRLQHYFNYQTLPLSAVGRLSSAQSIWVRLTCYAYVLHYQRYLWRQKLKALRRWFFTFHTRKGQRLVRILGINLISEEKR